MPEPIAHVCRPDARLVLAVVFIGIAATGSFEVVVLDVIIRRAAVKPFIIRAVRPRILMLGM